MIGGQSAKATTRKRTWRHDREPPLRPPPRPLARSFVPSSWTWKLCGAFAVVSLQVILCIDGGISFSITTQPSYEAASAAGPALAVGGKTRGHAVAATLPAAMTLPKVLSVDGTAPPPALIRIGEQAMPPASDLQSRVASCLIEPPRISPGSRGPVAELDAAPATIPPAGAVLPADAGTPPASGKAGRAFPGSADARGANNCALLMGLILLGASDPALRFRGGLRGP